MSTTFGRVPYVLPWKTAAHEGLRRNQAALTAFSFRCPRAWGKWKDKTHSVNIQQQPKTKKDTKKITKKINTNFKK